MVLESFYGFVEEQVELISREEKVARNSIIIAEVSLEQVKNRVEKWHKESDHVLARFQVERSYIVYSLRSRGLTNEPRNGITAERENRDRLISGMVEQRKNLEKDILLKRKILAEKKMGFHEIIN